jgi:outer membrane lipoprotein SlyB
VGAVAGGVAGAVLGNQVGNGNGKTVATILGAIGGGFAGNAIEKNMKKETVYQVSVRMDDGSRRTVEVAQPPAVGSKVTVDGSSIRSNEGAVYRAPAPVVQRTNQPAPVYQAP